MTNKKYVVPEGMLQAATQAYNSKTAELGYKYYVDRYVVEEIVRAAVRWLAENPIVPTNEQVEAIHVEQYDSTEDFLTVSKKNMAVEWQRQMFLSPKSRIPEAVEDLWIDENSISFYKGDPEAIAARGNRAILEAYRRGREGR